MSRALVPLTVLLALAGCGRNGPLAPWPTFDLGDRDPSTGGDLGGAPNDLAPPPDLTPPPLRTWEWVAPTVTGNPLRAVGGTATDDLWLAGDIGTLLHWDGQRATVARDGAPNDHFFAVAARAKNDVWIGGQSSGGSILHWDGTSWSSDWSIANKTIHSLSVGNKYDYATVDEGGKGWIWRHAPGSGWWQENDSVFESGVPILRDVLSFGDESVYYFPLFTVGDKGTIVWRADTTWAKGRPAAPGDMGGASDPFSADKDYFGVWGATATDVWAAFTTTAGPQIGFTHWDGKAWTVKQTLPFYTAGSELVGPVDRGKRLVGLDATHIIAEPGPSAYSQPFVFDGTSWAPFSKTQPQPGQASFAAAGGRWYAVTGDGQLQVSNNDGSWTGLPSTSYRRPLYRVNVADDSVWASGGGFNEDAAFTWKAGAWQRSTPLPATYAISDVSAIDANDAWMSGQANSQGMVAHWDGKSWSAPTLLPGTDRMTSIWANSDEDVWAVGGGNPNDGWGFDSCHAFHYDGTSWTDVPVPAHPWGVASPSVWGLRSDAVFISLHIWNTTHRWVWKWDGSSIQQVAYWPEGDVQSFGRPWASSDDDVWIPSQPVIHWDGKAWSELAAPATDLDINAIYGTARDDVWAVGSGPFGGAIWHFDGTKFVTAVDMTSRMYDIRGSAHVLPWAVGDNGATLRLVEQPRKP